MAKGVLSGRDFLFRRRRAYRLTFNPEEQSDQDVLADLARFCRANESTYHPDPRMSCVLEGRREVFLRIAQHLNLSEEDLWAIYGRKDA